MLDPENNILDLIEEHRRYNFRHCNDIDPRRIMSSNISEHTVTLLEKAIEAVKRLRALRDAALFEEHRVTGEPSQIRDEIRKSTNFLADNEKMFENKP